MTIVPLASPGPIPNTSAPQLLGTGGITVVLTDLIDEPSETVQVRVVATLRAPNAVLFGLAKFLPDGTFRVLTQLSYAGDTWAMKATPWATLERPAQLTTLRPFGRSVTATLGEAVAVSLHVRAGAGGR